MSVDIDFPADLEQAAHRSGVEYAWRRSEAKLAARHLSARGHAILGGELWLVRGKEIWGVLPQKAGPPAVYHWEVGRASSESWLSYVVRSCSETLAAIDSLPPDGEVDVPPGADIYYNLTWGTDNE
jgi:hypothetical protein